MIADWYFTRCIGANPQHALTFLRILESLRSRNEEIRTIAVEQLTHVDEWMRLYALPRVLNVAVTIPSAAVLDAFYASLTEGRASADQLNDLLEAAGSARAQSCVDAFKAFAETPRREAAARAKIPYIDLREFADESIALAALRAAVARQPEIRDAFKHAGTAATELLHNALRHDLGRMAFLEGVSLAHMLGLRSRESLIPLIEEHADLVSEPDLATAYVSLSIFGSTDAGNRGPTNEDDLVRQLLQESILLSLFHRVTEGGATAKRADIPTFPVFNAIASPSTYRIVLWQLVLWSVAAEIKPAAAAAAFAVCWIPAQHRDTVFSIALDRRVSAGWLREVNGLISQRGVGKNAIRFERSRTLEPARDWWPVVSPWLLYELDAGDRGFLNTRFVRPTPVNVLRLLGATAIATRLLLRGDLEAEAASGMAALVAHAYDALQVFKYDDLDPDQSKIRMNDDFEGLARFVSRQVEVVVSGEAGVDPELFVSLLEDEGFSDDEQIFRREILPLVLVSFISAAIPVATQDSGAARWIDLLTICYPYIENARSRERVEAEILGRYLTRIIPGQNWLETALKSQWNIKPERLLLPRECPAIDWWHPDWFEPDEQHAPAIIPLRRVQRFAASFANDGQVPEDVTSAWRTEFLDSVAAMTPPPSQFLCLRLHEILFDPAIKASATERLAIFFLLVESGSPSDIERLANALFPPSAPPARDAELRRHFITTAIRAAETAESELPEATDPRRVLRNRREALAFRTALRRAALYAHTKEAFASLLPDLRSAAHESERRRTPSLYRASFELLNDTDIEMPAAEPGLVRQVRSITRDPNRMTATVLYEEFDFDPTVINLLYLPPGSTAPVVDASQRPKILGIVVANEDGQLMIDCGLDSFVHAGGGINVGTGALVRLQLSAKEDGTLIGTQVQPLAAKNDLSPAVVTLQWRDNLPEIVHGRTPIPIEPSPAGHVDWNYWVPDLRTLFGARTIGRVLAERLDDNEWRPMTRDLWRFLINYGQQAHAMVVSFDDRRLIVSPAPGSLYAISLGDLHPDALQRIRGLQDQFKDLRGLGLPLTADVDVAGRVFLCLEEASCDDANLRWRRLFSDENETLTARRDEQGYRYRIPEPIPGFPEYVTVSFEQPQFSPTVDFTVENPTDWDPFRAHVQGSRTVYERLEAKPHERPTLVEKLLHIKKTDRLQVAKPRRRVNERGEIVCVTREGMTLDVKLETLTFGVPTQNLVGGARDVEVTYVNTFPEIVYDGGPDDVPPEIFHAGGGEGIIARAPRADEASRKYQVWWQCGDRVAEHEVLLEGKPQYVGTPISAAVKGDAVELTVKPRRIKCDAVWRRVDSELSPDSIFLGVVGGQAIVERRPGEFVEIPRSRARAKHLARWRTTPTPGFAGGLTGRERVAVQPIGNINRKRAMVALPDNSENVVWGDTFDTGDMVTDVRLTVGRAAEPDRFILRRTFELGRRPVEVVSRPDDSARYQQFLDEYFARADRTLEVSVVQRRDSPPVVQLSNLRVPAPNGKWSATVPFGGGEGAWVGGAHYRGTGARVQLIRDASGNIFASARAVPSLSVATYHDRFDAELGEDIALEQPLHYAGETNTKGVHRFEWDYGWTIEAHEEELRFLKFPFDTARELIFFGDAVRSIRFKAQGDPPRYTLVLNNLSIDYSDSSTIFFQRRKHNIVHLLRLRPRKASDGTIGGAEITSVVGMQEETADTAHGYDRTRATLTRASEARVVARLRKAEQEESAGEVTIYGRLDEKTFRRTLGQQIHFDLVELTFADDRKHRLRSRELVFLAAGQGMPRRNDYALSMHVPEGIAAEDVGPDARDMNVLRRGFSVREEVLPRLMRRDRSALAGQLFLVRLWPHEKGVRLSLWWRREDTEKNRAPALPTRRAEVLQPLIERSFVLATVIDVHDRGIDIEYSPGIFISVPTRQIEFASPDLLRELEQGSVIRIDRVAGKPYLISRAQFSDARYLGSGLRPIVALPKNELFDRKKSEPWQLENESWALLRFPLGGMPDVLAMPGSYNVLTKAWGDPDPAQFRDFMTRSHPKLALAGRDRADIARLEPGRTKVPVGSIAVDPDTQEPRFESDAAAAVPLQRKLRWPYLTFADAGVRTITLRLAREWRYHDEVTCVWQPDGEIALRPLPAHNGFTGPLVFAEDGGDLRLRYRETALEQFGYPSRELVNYLNERGDSDWFSVAAVTPTSMWIEIAPGRLAELPFAQIVHALAPAASMHSLEWTLFAPGDAVELRLASTDPKTPDRIAIIEWLPSLRGAAGNRMVLPVAANDRSQGALQLGHGDFRMEYPWTAETTPPAVFLTPDNRAWPFDQRDMERGDTALLALDQRGNLCIAGCSGITLAPSRDGWTDDPMAIWFRRLDAEEIVRAAGGAIPITIEDIDRRRAFFSRRRQAAQSVLQADRMTVARVLGVIDDDRFLMRSGSALFVARSNAAISGLPKPLATSMAATLAVTKQSVWIRGGGAGDIALFGLRDERTAIIRAQAIAVASERDSAGLACRSLTTQSLYWLPANDAAWTRLTPNEMRQVFVEREFPFRAQLRPDEAGHEVLSVTRTPDALAELRDLHIGDELSVRIVGKRDPSGYLVATHGSGILMTCTDGEADNVRQFKTDSDLRVEVKKRFTAFPPVLTVAKYGTRLPELDIPRWMLGGEAATRDIPPPMKRTLDWASSGKITPRRNLASAPESMIDQALVEAWGCFQQRSLNLMAGVQIAETWCDASWNRDELDLGHALMCLSLLQHLSAVHRSQQRRRRHKADESRSDDTEALVHDWNDYAGRLLAQIAARAARSLHSEVLSKRWLKTDQYREPRRIFLLRSNLQEPVTPAKVNAIRQFCRATDIHDSSSDPVPRMIADACRRASGEAEHDDNFRFEADLLQKVIRLGDAFTAAPAPNRKLHEAYLRQIDALLGKIIANKILVTLMQPLRILEV